MKIAFDVNGTLDGSKKTLLIELFHRLTSLGHTCIVWSSDYQTAKDCVLQNNLNCEFTTKNTKIDCRNQDIPFVDIAIDDDYSSHKILGAHQVILVQQFENNVDSIIKTYFS